MSKSKLCYEKIKCIIIDTNKLEGGKFATKEWEISFEEGISLKWLDLSKEDAIEVCYEKKGISYLDIFYKKHITRCRVEYI